jgi:hypothetical protein
MVAQVRWRKNLMPNALINELNSMSSKPSISVTDGVWSAKWAEPNSELAYEIRVVSRVLGGLEITNFIYKNGVLSKTFQTVDLDGTGSLGADLSSVVEKYYQVVKAAAQCEEFTQAARLFLDRRGHVEGKMQVYRGATYAFERQANTLTAYKRGREIFKQVGDQVVVDLLTPPDLNALQNVNQYLEKFGQATSVSALVSHNFYQPRQAEDGACSL